ncbi:MAG: SRPBCC family protein [Bacteroidales bacterium]|nr:SRPBCC family protein [Bacteroidales bacterium]
MRIESKVGKIPRKDETVYNFFSDFDNFKSLIPADKVKNFSSQGDSCSFSIDMIGDTGLKIIEKEPYKLIKLSSPGQSKFEFKLWIQLKDLGDETTAVKLTLETFLNPMLEIMAKKPLQNFVDTLADQLGRIDYR